MPYNDAGPARAVFLQLLINGAALGGVSEVEICTSDHQAAGWFRATAAFGRDPIFTPAAFASMRDATAQILVGLAAPGLPQTAAVWQSLMTGTVDAITLDMTGSAVEIIGRDFTALFIDALSAETFANRTSSAIVQTLAVRHGLTPVVTETATPVGRYYQEGHDLFSLHQASQTITEWDLLSALAAAEGFDLYVQDQSLFFAPPLSNALPAVWRWMPGGTAATTLTTLQMERSLALAKDIVVTVQSWNSRQAQMITQTVRASALGNPQAGRSASPANATRYVVVRPNLTPQQAMNLATRTLADLSRHERVITATMPGELNLAPRSPVLLQGTNTGFDQTYAVDEITRRVSVRHGFMQTVRAINTTTEGAP
ncbi:MAG: hypothetical protein HIU92_17720 [Proteobacteria bacterium]|nr:hypothetical protein [Pseudomonadota bacterium]